MTPMKLRLTRVILAAIAGIAGLSLGEVNLPTVSPSFITSAYAIIGPLLTPMSYAGVASRKESESG
jgi:hypothetical protein